MPVSPTYPGVYVEEIPSGVRTIMGVATSITAFIGAARRGPENKATRINSFSDFERQFGGLWKDSMLGFAVRDFFINGGQAAVIVRITPKNEIAPDKRDKARDTSGIKTVLDTLIKAAKDALADDNVTLAKAKDAAATKLKEIQDASEFNDITKTQAESINKIIQAIAAGAAGTAVERKKLITDEFDKADNALTKFVDAAKEEVSTLPSNAWASLPQDADGQAAETSFKISAMSSGAWGNDLYVRVDYDNLPADKDIPPALKAYDISSDDLFNLSVYDAKSGQLEVFRNLTMGKSPREIDGVLKNESQLVAALTNVEGNRPTPTDTMMKAGLTALDITKLKAIVNDDPGKVLAKDAAIKLTSLKSVIVAGAGTASSKRDEASKAVDALASALKAFNDGPSDNTAKQVKTAAEGLAKPVADATTALTSTLRGSPFSEDNLPLRAIRLSGGGDGSGLGGTDITDAGDKRGLYALDKAAFNLLCIPPLSTDRTLEPDLTLVLQQAIAYCEKRRAMLLVDPPGEWNTKEDARGKVSDYPGTRHKNAALFFPRLLSGNPLKNNLVESFVPSGAMAGIFARTDLERGVWKAPAGLDATLRNVLALEVELTDEENGELNPLGVNCLRSFPVGGRVVWGSRTLRGADQLADEWKYIPVRRTALYIEQSLFEGLQWVVFEPNDEPLWASIRLNVGAFMQSLFRKGAFQGRTPREAYFVKCDKDSTTQTDINMGIVNIHVGFAPLKPAEFVIIKLQQMAGQIEA